MPGSSTRLFFLLTRTPQRRAHAHDMDYSMTYNMDGSDFYKLANKFKKQFQDQYNKIKQSNDAEEARNAVVDLDRTPTLDEQTQFAHNIYIIKSEELGEVRSTKSEQLTRPSRPVFRAPIYFAGFWTVQSVPLVFMAR